MQTQKALYSVDKSRIGFLKYIFEAHEGLAVITTLNADQGLVRFAIAPDCEDDVRMILDDLRQGFEIHDH